MQDNIIDEKNERNIRNHAKNALQSGVCEYDVKQANERLNKEKQDSQVISTMR